MLRVLAVLAVGWFVVMATPPAQAVPASGLSVKHQSIVQDAYWRRGRCRCWWRWGRRHCRCW
jgi:hypothetical protein